MSKLLIPLLVTSGLFFTPAKAFELSDSISKAMQSDIRSEKDKNRDRNRRPVETLTFFGIEEDMKVLELIPGGGWYTSLLAPALQDKGALYEPGD